MTITEAPTTALLRITHDLYRDIHKGIRDELFAVTGNAGRFDPSDRGARQGVADHVSRAVDLLLSHAEHEDVAVGPVLEQHLPDLAEKIETDHTALDARMIDLRVIAAEAVDARDREQRGRMHRLYLELASFTSDYLAHQDVEERVVMPALQEAIGPDAVLGIHQAIIGAIPPDEMARSLAVMLPAMNLDDRSDMLGGMRAGAPPEVFNGVFALAGSVLRPGDLAALGARLGL